MISLEIVSGEAVVQAELPPGWLAFVDADWLPHAGGRTPAIAVSPEGTIQWGEGPAEPVPPGSDADACVGRALWGVAEEAANVARGTGEPRHVRGRGFIAAGVRDALGLPPGDSEPPPDETFGTIVDATGDPDAIADATRRLTNLGGLVLVGESAEGAIALDLYPDVHVRGLHVSGVAPPLHQGRRQASWGEGDPGRAVREAQTPLRPGDAVPGRALLYRISS